MTGQVESTFSGKVYSQAERLATEGKLSLGQVITAVRIVTKNRNLTNHAAIDALAENLVQEPKISEQGNKLLEAVNLMDPKDRGALYFGTRANLRIMQDRVSGKTVSSGKATIIHIMEFFVSLGRLLSGNSVWKSIIDRAIDKLNKTVELPKAQAIVVDTAEELKKTVLNKREDTVHLIEVVQNVASATNPKAVEKAAESLVLQPETKPETKVEEKQPETQVPITESKEKPESFNKLVSDYKKWAADKYALVIGQKGDYLDEYNTMIKDKTDTEKAAIHIALLQAIAGGRNPSAFVNNAKKLVGDLDKIFENLSLDDKLLVGSVVRDLAQKIAEWSGITTKTKFAT